MTLSASVPLLGPLAAVPMVLLRPILDRPTALWAQLETSKNL
jgi:hypothetical protein